MRLTDPAHRRMRHLIADLRQGAPAILSRSGSGLALVAMEMLDAERLAALAALNPAATPQPLVTGNRAEMLAVGSKGRSAVRLYREGWMSVERLMALGDPSQDLDFPLSGPYRRDDHEQPLDAAAIEALKAARLLPAAMIIDIDPHAVPDDAVGADAVMTWRGQARDDLQVITRAPVALAHAEQSEILAFRPADGGAEHYAIVIGDPDRHRPVMARVHSQCFTGDLLDSLKCDCGPQLRGAIRKISESGGGVVLYMAQEGRGIGLIAKLKAYSLQAQGYDTVDANLRLGFADDERDFAPAAAMLRALGMTRIRLLTNNPAKLDGLRGAGINVVERVAHQFASNPHNVDYLAVKARRSGHLLDPDGDAD